MATDITEKSSDTSSHEVEKLLKLAEDLQEKCEARERSATMQFGGGVLGILVSAVAGVYWLITFSREGQIPSLLISLMLVVSVVMLAYSAFFLIFVWNRTMRALRTDQRALLSIVDMLREIEKALADNHQMSTLERAEYRIRLSRFDIGPGTMPWSR